MIITASNSLDDRQIDETLGLVRAQATWLPVDQGSDPARGLENARSLAVAALQRNARQIAADAVIGLRTELIELSSGAVMVRVWGAAVVTCSYVAEGVTADRITDADDAEERTVPGAAGSKTTH
jgi:uncharacterized protein YbjQ (UPF0145 family)